MSLKKTEKVIVLRMDIKSIKKSLRESPITGKMYGILASRFSPYQRRKKAYREYGEESFVLTVRTLNEAGIEYFPAFGTLLGLVRDGHLITYDYDMDFGVACDEYDYDWDKLYQVMTDAGFQLLRWFDYEGRIIELTFAPPMSRLVNIDFFLFVGSKEESISYVCWREAGRSYKSDAEYTLYEEVFPAITQFKQHEYLGIPVRVPVQAEELLEISYTSSWRIPDPEWKDEYKPNRREVKGATARIHRPPEKPWTK
ncbi:MAG: hypothetical protein IKF90_26130 [Parasporobacterium sp.]|nr:hypothetical protein [Parasporobacterium sp.]